MTEENVHETQPSSRDDLKHTDTVSSATGPDGTETGAGGEEGPIGVRVERDPSNLGNDIPEEGDLVHPSPINQPLGKAPGM
jgi:hypothetical protein